MSAVDEELERTRADAEHAVLRARRLEAITLAGLSHPDLGSTLDALLEMVRDVLGRRRAAVHLLDERTRRVTLAAGTPGGGTRVPLVVDGITIGALEVDGDEDRWMLERVAERAALAIGHAQLRARERAVAETLLRSLLVQRLPDVPGVGLEVRYLPLMSGVGVGGDFYDALALDDGRLALSIGDVAGKGLPAASAMGRICHALRAYALEEATPADALERLDRLVVEGGEDMATALHLVLDPATGAVTYASAGHPPALRITAAGTTEWLTEALAPPLGAGVAPRPQATTQLASGDRLVLYTDGLIERRGHSLDTGLATLERGAAGRPFAALCTELVDEIAGADGFDDDVAVLAVELRG